MAFPNLALYDGQLVAHASVASRSLLDLPGYAPLAGDAQDADEALEEPWAAKVVFYDTSGGELCVCVCVCVCVGVCGCVCVCGCVWVCVCVCCSLLAPHVYTLYCPRPAAPGPESLKLTCATQTNSGHV
jgi:hypothetical protein